MRSFARNLRTFFLALALGLSVWVSAVSTANPDEEHSFPNPIPLEIVGQDPSLVLTSEIPSTVQVTLRAPHSVWTALTTREGSVRATLDLSGLDVGPHQKPVQVMISERPYQIVQITPQNISFHLESIRTHTFPLILSLSGQPATGYQAGDATMELREVAISGPQSLIRQAVEARVEVNLDGIRESIDESRQIQVVDAKGKPVKGISIIPTSVQVSIPISQQAGSRDVAVKVIVQGQQAAGYRIENISVFPQVVTVFANDPALVNALAGVLETQPLDLQDRKEDISARLNLNVPENITVVGARTVQVQVNISPIQTSITLPNLPINVNGLSEGLSAQVFPQTVDVIISGPLPVLDTLTAQDITVFVDVSGLDIGVYQLRPDVKRSLENITVESILPEPVEVVIALPSTPTPTAFPP